MKLFLILILASVAWAEDPKPTQPHLTSDDLLPYYKAQGAASSIVAEISTLQEQLKQAQAALSAEVQKLQAKCGANGIVGDGKEKEYDCGLPPPSPAPAK